MRFWSFLTYIAASPRPSGIPPLLVAMIVLPIDMASRAEHERGSSHLEGMTIISTVL